MTSKIYHRLKDGELFPDAIVGQVALVVTLLLTWMVKEPFKFLDSEIDWPFTSWSYLKTATFVSLSLANIILVNTNDKAKEIAV